MTAILTIAVILIGLVIFIGYMRSEDVEWKYILLILVIITGGGYF